MNIMSGRYFILNFCLSSHNVKRSLARLWHWKPLKAKISHFALWNEAFTILSYALGSLSKHKSLLWINLLTALRYSTCPLVFGYCELNTWFFSSWERKNCLQSWTNSQNDNYYHSKQQPRTILSKKIIVILWICSALQAVLSFSAWEKITWLNS